MDSIEKLLERLKDLARKLIEALLGPEAEPEPELIPIPVEDRFRRRS
jgi:predicted RNase H-like HicB family nuclease